MIFPPKVNDWICRAKSFRSHSRKEVTEKVIWDEFGSERPLCEAVEVKPAWGWKCQGHEKSARESWEKCAAGSRAIRKVPLTLWNGTWATGWEVLPLGLHAIFLTLSILLLQCWWHCVLEVCNLLFSFHLGLQLRNCLNLTKTLYFALLNSIESVNNMETFQIGLNTFCIMIWPQIYIV